MKSRSLRKLSSTKTKLKSTALNSAHKHWLETGDSIRKSAKMYSVPESTLRAHIHNPHLKNNGHPTLLTLAEENELANHVRKMALLGYGYSRWQACDLATNMLLSKGRKVQPQLSWYYGFVERMNLKTHKPKMREFSRVQGSHADNIKGYFEELKSVLMKYDLLNKTASLWNVDETGITLDSPPPKIVSGKDDKPFIVSSSKRATTTVIAAGSALGETIPPYVIYKGQRLMGELTTGCLPQTKFTMSKNGWSTSETFLDFFKNHFLIHEQERPCLLLYDGHLTHITQDVKDNVHMFVLPPHSSHQLQPLDVGVFGPLKAALATAAHKIMHSEVGRQVLRSDLPSLIASAYKSSMTVPNLQSAFRKTGIVPFNSSVVCSTSFVKVNTARPKSRKERKDVRTMKLLLAEIDENVEKKIEQMSCKPKEYIIPKQGAAITETDFIEKLKWKGEATKPEEKKVKEESRKTYKCISKRKGKQEKDITPEVIDSQEAGPSRADKGWQTFYDTCSEDMSEDEDDEELCVMCGLFSPPEFGKTGRVEFLNWAKCDSCCKWVHLKYCTDIVTVQKGESFVCPKC